LKVAKYEKPETHPLLEQQVATAHRSLNPSLGTQSLNANDSSDWCALYNLNFSQKERLLSRVARAATVVADKCDDIETTYVPLVLQTFFDDLTPVVGAG
jgi:hypothetical protein